MFLAGFYCEKTSRIEVLIGAETLPPARDGDAYMMRLILHDWDDKDSTAILTSIRKAMGNAKAKLLVIEVNH